MTPSQRTHYLRVLPAMLLLLMLVGGSGDALAADPFVGYVYPCGVQAGSSARLLLGGQNLQGVQGGIVTGEGVNISKITIVPNFPRADSRQRKYLLAWIADIEKGNKAPPPLPDSTDGWRENAWWQKLHELAPMELRLVLKDLHTIPNALQASPAIRQLVIVDVAVAADAAPGERELRLYGRGGISAPKLFYVDAAPHCPEPSYRAPDEEPAATPRVAAVPAVLDGQILPGETDRFVVALKGGQSYRCALYGRRLLPFIGDAVPGHFQAVLRLLDATGREVAFADDEYFDPDPVLRFACPTAGDYTLEVRDNLYRGREDFVYRVDISLGTRPYPFTAPPWPALPQLSDDDAGRQPRDGATAQVIAGTIARPGETDSVRVIGRKGAAVVFDLAARRCASPLDAVMSIRGPDGSVIATVDDHPVPFNAGTCLQYVDPYLMTTFPADGIYDIQIRDVTGAGGDDYRYWLRIGPPQPSFLVYTTKSSLSQPNYSLLTFVAARLDGFVGPITLASKELIFTRGNVIPADKDRVTLQVRCPAFHHYSRPWPASISASAEGSGQPLHGDVIPADECTQAFAYTHLLPVASLYVNASSRPPGEQRAMKQQREKDQGAKK